MMTKKNMRSKIIKKNYVRFNRIMTILYKRSRGWHQRYQSPNPETDYDNYIGSEAYIYEIKLFNKLTDKIPDDAGDYSK